MRGLSRKLLESSRFKQTTPDGRQYTPKVSKEVGTWLYTKEQTDAFTKFCTARHVKARGNTRVASSQQFARALRTTKPLFPGDGIITLPLNAGFNFLSVAKLMYDTPHTFPLQVNWMNWNQRVRSLKGAATHELVTAGWMCRIHSMAEQPWAPYISWLLSDTSGRQGIANGICQDRGDNNGDLDQLLTEMANDGCDEAEDFLENFFRSVACLMTRTIPIETRAIDHFLPGTNFFKAKAHELFVPTFFPLLDCVPHMENGMHNCLVDYFPPSEANNALCRELSIPEGEFDHDAFRESGVVVLRALEALPRGEYVTVRSWPKTERHDEERISNTIMETTRVRQNDLA